MKRNSPTSLTARVTLGAVLSLSGIALLCVLPVNDSYAAKAKQKVRTPVPQRSPAIRPDALPNTGPTPSSGSVNASGTQTSSWDGTTISPGGNQNTDTTCMDNSPVFGCETFTLTVIGTQ